LERQRDGVSAAEQSLRAAEQGRRRLGFGATLVAADGRKDGGSGPFCRAAATLVCVPGLEGRRDLRRGSRAGVAGGGRWTWRAGPGWQRAGGAGVWGRAAAGRGDAALRAGWLAPPGGASVAVGACGPSTPRGRSGAEAREGRLTCGPAGRGAGRGVRRGGAGRAAASWAEGAGVGPSQGKGEGRGVWVMGFLG